MTTDDRRGPTVDPWPDPPLSDGEDRTLNMVLIGVAVFLLFSGVGGCVAFIKVVL